jgi:hypothetical protein
MQIRCLVLSFLFFVCFSKTVFAQFVQQSIGFTNGNLVMTNNITNKTFQKSELISAQFRDHYFVAIQFSILPGALTQNNLKRAGIELYDYLPGKAYLAAVKDGFNFSTAALFNISSINAVPPFYKVDQGVDTK